MARLRGRAKAAINEAKGLADTALEEWRAAQREAERREAIYYAYAEAYDKLSRTLAATPRQPSTVGTVKKKRRRCTRKIGGTICGNLEKSQIHTLTSHLSYHPFQPAPSAASQSLPNNGAALSTASLETPVEDAPDAVHASAGGE